MKARSKEEWQEWYRERTGIEDLDLLSDELVLFHLEYGFVAFFLDDEETLYMHHMCGDGQYWFKILREVMQARG